MMSYYFQIFGRKSPLALLLISSMCMSFPSFSKPPEKVSDGSQFKNQYPVSAQPVPTTLPLSTASPVNPSAISTTISQVSYSSPVHRLSLGVELGGGINISGIARQWYFESHISLGIDVYNSCLSSKGKTCFRFYVLTPVLGGGYYHQSRLPFFQAGVGLGIRIHFLQWLEWLFEGGAAAKFSPIGSFTAQQDSGVNPLYRMEPDDSILPVGWLQTGMSFDLGQRLNASSSKGTHLQVTVRIGDGPRLYHSEARTLDLALLVGVRWYF